MAFLGMRMTVREKGVFHNSINVGEEMGSYVVESTARIS